MSTRQRQLAESTTLAGQGVAFALAASSAHNPARHNVARQLKLHVGHFAFMRSVVQGLDPRESWERYIRIEGEATDQRTVRSLEPRLAARGAALYSRPDRAGPALMAELRSTALGSNGARAMARAGQKRYVQKSV